MLDRGALADFVHTVDLLTARALAEDEIRRLGRDTLLTYLTDPQATTTTAQVRQLLRERTFLAEFEEIKLAFRNLIVPVAATASTGVTVDHREFEGGEIKIIPSK